MHLLEIALVDGMAKESDTLQPFSVNSLGDLLEMVTGDCGGLDLDNHSKCSLQGILVIFTFRISWLVNVIFTLYY